MRRIQWKSRVGDRLLGSAMSIVGKTLEVRVLEMQSYQQVETERINQDERDAK